MKVLQIGASGFIGSAVARALLADGHTIRAAGRDLRHGRRVLPEAEWVRCDLRDLGDPAAWDALLGDVEVVINASGALQSGLRDDVIAVQHRAIAALVEAHVPRPRLPAPTTHARMPCLARDGTTANPGTPYTPSPGGRTTSSP
jgi:uncharacterized protein YbjT (DUF2867 family)